ncbi:MAG: hypothetical protein AABX99_01755 [Nanoarchaeota archaeon]
MIIFFGKSLIFWTGILTGLFFILSFFGCRCLNGKCPRIFTWTTKNHNIIIKLTLALFLIHATLAILPILGVYI